MKVVMVTDMYARPDQPAGGAFVHRQAVELARMGVEIRVLYPYARFGPRLWLSGPPEPDADRYALDGISVSRFAYPKFLPLRTAPALAVWWLARELRREGQWLRREFPFDLIHAHLLFPIGSAALELSRSSGAPLVVTARGGDVHTYPVGSRGIGRQVGEVIAGADQVLSVSRALLPGMRSLGRPRRPMEVVYNGVDVDRFRPVEDPTSPRRALGLPESGIGLCFVGRLVRDKGIFELLDAFETLCVRHPDLWLAFVGPGPLAPEMERRIQDRDLGGRVVLAGARPADEVADYLAAADMLVLPSYAEGLPNVVLEAMACGRPVVATDVGGTSEALVDGITGLLVPPRDADALGQALERLVSDRAMRARMGQAGRRRACEAFGWGRSAELLLDVYRRTLDARSSGSSRSGDPGADGTCVA